MKHDEEPQGASQDTLDAARAELLALLLAEGAPTSHIERRPPNDEPSPLSFGQEALWFLSKLGAQSGAYNLPLPDNDGTLSTGLTVTYTSAVFNSSMTPYSSIPANTLVNLNVNWKGVAGKPVDAEVFVTNLLNREYVGLQRCR